ncbi:hypothetical protein GCM10009779_22480 [Polymorphospora rubra]|uniref:Uncharacterized protein n=2 Tax=Polymorphospora rubra TaxID=338584 RepID=A0A810N1D5_9ACTN|nr:hypothetical protein Prubr_42530 [Polymorphospora rubra]
MTTTKDAVKAMDIQRWMRRTHLFEFIGISSADGGPADLAAAEAFNPSWTVAVKGRGDPPYRSTDGG